MTSIVGVSTEKNGHGKWKTDKICRKWIATVGDALNRKSMKLLEMVTYVMSKVTTCLMC